MHALRSSAFVMDLVQNDAFRGDPLSSSRTQEFWPAWFAGFAEMDIEITRTIAAETVVVTQWVFTGTHTEPLTPPDLWQLRRADRPDHSLSRRVDL